MAKTVTAVGNAQIDTAQSKFGGASGLFDGTGDYLTIADSADFAFGTGDFSIDFWYRINSLSNQSFFSQGDGTGSNLINFFFWNTAGGRIALNIYQGGSSVLDFQCTAALSINTWYHIELTRSSNTWYVFIDGVSATLTLNGGSYSNSYPDFSEDFRIGAQDNNSNYVNGWLDEYRVSKGIARHTANFTPETSEYTADAYTKLLLRMNGSDGATVFTDTSTDSPLNGNIIAYWKLDESSGNAADSVGPKTLTNNGTTPFSSAKINNGADFNGTTRYLSRASETIGLTSAWTVSTWVKFNALNADEYFIRWRPSSGDANEIRISKISTNKLEATAIHSSGSGTGLKQYIGNTTVSTGVWYHVAVSWDGSDFKLYLDGAEDTPYSKTSDSTLVMTDTSRIQGVGGWNTNDYSNVSIDELGTWSTALSSSDILALYNSGNGLQYPFITSLIAALGSFTLTGQAVTFAQLIGTLVAEVGNFILTGFGIVIPRSWNNKQKSATATVVNRTKHTSNWNNKSKT